MSIITTVSKILTSEDYQRYLDEVQNQALRCYDLHIEMEVLQNHEGVKANYIAQADAQLANHFEGDYWVYHAQAFDFFKKEFEAREKQKEAERILAEKELEEHGAKIFVPADQLKKARALLIAAGVIQRENNDFDLNTLDQYVPDGDWGEDD